MSLETIHYLLLTKKTMHDKRLIVFAAGGYYLIKYPILTKSYFLTTSFENQTSNNF